ncbi:MAG: acyl-CoA synthetase (AMP-forming)/AMP-acid ligase II [Gammaproteobacteria bacterium]|jgi:acyl-CoA synthetase (AMP-forming)/AMP-acid ligase II
MTSTTVYEAFVETCACFPNRPFLHVVKNVAERYAIDVGEISYREAERTITGLINQYQRAGYGGGHRIALMLGNRPAFIFHWFALNALGASVVPVNAELSAAEQADLIDHSGVCLLLYVAEHEVTMRAAVAECASALAVSDINRFDLLPQASAVASLEASDAHSECAILFTSGSTGQPKGCLLSNEYFLEMGRWYRDIGGLCSLESGVERLITPLPLTHMNAMGTSLMAMVITGGCLVQLDRFHAKSWWQAVRESRATVIHYLGVMPAILLQLATDPNEAIASVKFGFGAGVNPAHHDSFEQRFGFPLVEAWAMTETGTAVCVIANHEPRHIGQSCFGKPDRCRLEFRLVDETGIDVASGEGGELLVRAIGENPRKGFFSGYLLNDAATAQGWDGGWWHTGDVARELTDGSLCFVDRRKNIIRRSGENIAALEVEAVLSRHAAPTALAVTPVPDEIRGDEVMACIVLNPDFLPTEETAVALFEHCLAQLAYFKAPGYVMFLDSLPLTATQKPKRNEIKVLARDQLERPSANVKLFDFRERKRRPSA